MKYKTISVRIPIPVYRAFEDEAFALDISDSQMFCKLASRYFRCPELKLPQGSRRRTPQRKRFLAEKTGQTPTKCDKVNTKAGGTDEQQ